MITIGPDGLVVNTAKYLQQQPILAVNPTPEQIDGVLLPFLLDDFAQALAQSSAIQPPGQTGHHG